MLMLGGQGGQVELCPKATHYCTCMCSKCALYICGYVYVCKPAEIYV